MKTSFEVLNGIQREFFNILAEYFKKATGSDYLTFSKRHEFHRYIRESSDERARNIYMADQWVRGELHKYYAMHKMTLFVASKEFGGMKLVMGNFGAIHSDSVRSIRKMLLYCDTILLPDPILPWIEDLREDEKFRHVLLLRSAYTLLHLKPLIDANDLPYPPIIVFPSYEKSLERDDTITQRSIDSMVMAYFANVLEKEFLNTEDLIQYVRSDSSNVINMFDIKKAFLGPNGSIDDTIETHLLLYRDNRKKWNSKDYNNVIQRFTDSEVVYMGIMERMAPQYHLLENARELNAQPMLTVDQAWFYYNKCVSACDTTLSKINVLSPHALATLRSIGSEKCEWLGNIPVEGLVILRQENENEYFRKRMDEFTKTLMQSTFDDMNRMAAEVGRGFASLMAEHGKTARIIESKYRRMHSQTAVTGWITLGAVLLPTLAPFLPVALGPAAMAIGMKYGWDKINELHEKRQLSKSMLGVLATVQD